MHLEGLGTEENTEGWACMPSPPKWYATTIFLLIFRCFSRFWVIFTRFGAFGSPSETRDYRRGGLPCLTLQNGDFLLIFAHFREFRLNHSHEACFHAPLPSVHIEHESATTRGDSFWSWRRSVHVGRITGFFCAW
jgi:hypothetical protein